MPPRRNLAVAVATEQSEPNNFVSIGGSLHLAQGFAVTQKGVKSDTKNTFLSLSVDDLEEIGYCGKGSSGSVKKVRHKTTGQIFAVKEIKLGGEHHLQEISKELGTLYGSKADSGSVSPYIIDFEGAYASEGSVFIALEAMDGSLMDLGSSSGAIPENVLASITKPVLRGLNYLHKGRKLVHRDIKPHNLLYKVDGTIKITDFGVCSQLESTVAGADSFVGTVTYMSPERLSGMQYSFSADIWGIGISLLQLATAEHPYEKLTQNQGTEMKFWTLVTHLKECSPPEPKGNYSPEFKDFVAKCLIKDKDQRASSAVLLEHPWITKYTTDSDEENKEIVKRWISSVLASSASPTEAVETGSGGGPSSSSGGGSGGLGKPQISQKDLENALDNLVLFS